MNQNYGCFAVLWILVCAAFAWWVASQNMVLFWCVVAIFMYIFLR